MRFKLGFALGFVAGQWWATTSADERRAKLDEAWAGVRDNPRLQRVTDAVTRDAHRLGDAVERRMVETTDGAMSTIAHSVEPGDGTGTGPGGSSRSSKR
jgi:hypothetical protein